MKYIYLLLFIASVPCCLCSNVNTLGEGKTKSDHKRVEKLASLPGLPVDLLRNIMAYTGEPDTLSNVNQTLRDKITLRDRVLTTFGLRLPNNIDDNNPEFNYVLELSWTKDDPYLFFAGLMEQIDGGKKPYKVLFRPLVLHLDKMFQAFDAQKQEDYNMFLIMKKNVISVQDLLADRCLETGHYDLFFDKFKGTKGTLTNFLSKFKGRNPLIEYFRSNPNSAYQYLDALLTLPDKDSVYVEPRDSQSSRWIAECIINDLPEDYYVDLFAPNSQKREVFLIKYLFLSANVPESEYQRIHAQIRKLFGNYAIQIGKPRRFEVLSIINDIRYGSFDLEDYNKLDIKYFDFIEIYPRSEIKELSKNPLINFSEDHFHPIKIYFHYEMAQAALLANNKDLFSEIHYKYSLDLGKIVENIHDLNVNSLQAKNFKFIFEMIDNNPNIFQIKGIILLYLKFYAIYQLQLDNRSVTFKFEVDENLLKFGFSHLVEINRNNFNYYTYSFMNILKDMEVYNERTLNSLLPSMIKYYRSRKDITTIYVPYKFIEYISNFPDLLNLFIEEPIKLFARKDDEFFEKYFNLPNFQLTSKIIDFGEINFYLEVPKLKTKDHFQKMEEISRLCNKPFSFNIIAIDYSESEKDGEAKLYYFKWRLAFDYWIKGPHRDGIKQIQNPEIIAMLRLEFPNETNELLGPEQS